MRTLHLFAGVGGGIIADMMLGHEVVGAVEINKYCRSVLRARMNDCLIPEFPIFNDVRSFCGDEVERVEMLCGGFPCQDICSGGKKAGIKGERSGLFTEIVRIAKKTGCPFVFLENSSDICNRGLKEVLRAFSAIGYDAAWQTLRASDCGACHSRNRWWCLLWRADALHVLSRGRKFSRTNDKKTANNQCAKKSNAFRNEFESRIRRMADGLAYRLDFARANKNYFWNAKNAPRIDCSIEKKNERLFGIGNGQVSICAAAAQIILFESFLEVTKEEVKEAKK